MHKKNMDLRKTQDKTQPNRQQISFMPHNAPVFITPPKLNLPFKYSSLASNSFSSWSWMQRWVMMPRPGWRAWTSGLNHILLQTDLSPLYTGHPVPSQHTLSRRRVGDNVNSAFTSLHTGFHTKRNTHVPTGKCCCFVPLWTVVVVWHKDFNNMIHNEL